MCKNLRRFSFPFIFRVHSSIFRGLWFFPLALVVLLNHLPFVFSEMLGNMQVSCIRRTGQAISLKKDPCVLLISTKKSHASSNIKINDKKISPMCYGPAENAHVAKYRMVLERSPFSLDRKKWSNVERENLAKGIKQQFQELVLQMSINQDKWLNCEEPLINHIPWTCEEDKLLLHIIQEIGNRNWFKIATSLNTNRSPFQCLARYQRGLNPFMLNSEWTKEEDALLRSAVAIFDVSNWQSVASVLERRN